MGPQDPPRRRVSRLKGTPRRAGPLWIGGPFCVPIDNPSRGACRASRYYLTRRSNRLNNCSKLEREENEMKSFADRVVRLLAPVLISGVTIAISTAANAQQEAITATVIGENIQKVGYRAMIQKQAIKYNLAGYARNNTDGTVAVGLQGDQSRIAKTLEAVSAGNKKSSKANIIGEAQDKVRVKRSAS